MMPMTRAPAPKVGVAGILVRPDGRVLLGRRAQDPNRGHWAFPGGKVEFHERVKDALQREYYEETGIRVQVGELVYVAELMDSTMHYIVLDYLVGASDWSGVPSSDIDALQWVDAQDWWKRPLAVGMESCLRDPRVLNMMGWAPS